MSLQTPGVPQQGTVANPTGRPETVVASHPAQQTIPESEFTMRDYGHPYSNGSTYDPLHFMVNTGEARLDGEGVMVDSGEYVAALYESYAADNEWSDGNTAITRPPLTPVTTWFEGPQHDYTIGEYGKSLESLGSYCGTAQSLAEELWARDVEEIQGDQLTWREQYDF